MPSVRVPGAPIQCAVEGAQPPWFQLGRQTHRVAGKERDLLEKNNGFRYWDCKDSMPEYSDIHRKINTLVANSTLEGAGTFDTPSGQRFWPHSRSVLHTARCIHASCWLDRWLKTGGGSGMVQKTEDFDGIIAWTDISVPCGSGQCRSLS
ncbi:hypothetical protein K438DRAFT_1761010 [Mycena galopus ATCC 62051]|nr:hypothetical protein K438DRAFT_1781729 [Mycena galopus ATCC 62051]KAF8195354.1 hypothetical protein K438DRAFT_1761010 [Mycena galopus ATCC 62051]